MEQNKSDETVVQFPKEATKPVSSTERIWGKQILRHGYTGIPSILIRSQARLGLNALQMNILIQLLDYLIDPGRMPFPTKKDLAKRIGVTDKTIQLNMRKLENAKFLIRETRKTAAGDWNSNIYHLDGLIEKVRMLEPEFQQAREEKMKASKKAGAPVFKPKPLK